MEEGATQRVFCLGPLLHAVQQSGLYDDCKHFVDMSFHHDEWVQIRH